MNTYLFGNHAVISSLDFKQLPRLQGAVIVSGVRIDLLEPHLPEEIEWQHEWKESDDSVTLAVARHPSGFLLRFPELCDFILDIAQRHVSVLPHDVLDEYSIEHLLVDQVLPRFLAQEGHLLLHACAVNIGDRAILFLGRSGWGKSTLAALFHRAGYRLYSDDCVLLQHQASQWQSLPTYPSLRLYEDSIENILGQDSSLSWVSEYSDKQRIALVNEPEHEMPNLHAMYFLSDPEHAANDIEITPMRPGNTCIELIERSFRLDIGDPAQSRQLMRSTAALTQCVPAYRLSYPHDFKNNTTLLASLLRHIER